MALVSQVILLRQLMVAFYGSETTIALVLAGWLTGVYLGARIMGLIEFDRHRLKSWLLVLPPIWIALVFGLLLLSYFIPGLLGLSPGEVASLDRVLVWAVILTIPAGFFVGGLFVLAGSYLDEHWPREHFGREGVGAAIFWIESIGSCIGLLIYTFYLVGRYGSIQVFAFYGLAVVLAQAAALPRLVSTRLILTPLIVLIGVGIHYGGLAAGLDRSLDHARFARAHPAYKLLEVEDTPYQHLALATRGGETAMFGNQVFLSSWPDPYQYQVLTMFFLTEAARFDRVLLAGQGPGGFIHEILARKVERLVYVALDPAETALAASYLEESQVKDLQDPRLTIVHDDVRRYLSLTDDVFDLVIINAPDPDNARVNRLYTEEFFQSARLRLSDQGVLITSITGAENYWGRELLSYGLSLYQTIRRVFPEVLVTPGDRHYFLAGVKPGLVTDNTDVLAERYRKRGFTSKYMTPRSFPLFFPPTGREYIKDRLAGAESGRINTDAAPLSYFLHLIWWEQMTGKSWTRAWLAGAADVRAWGPWAAGLLCLPLLLILIRPSPARAAWWTMTMTGGTAMALQIILIFLFQNKYGVIYREIGLLSALFMFGLAAGGFIGRLTAGVDAINRRLIPVLEFSLAALAGITAWAASEPRPDLILPLVALTGLIGGFEFALLFAFYLQDGSSPPVSEALARLEAADHGGAVLGALLTGLILAPVLGLAMTAAALAGLKILSGLVLIRPLAR